jgi:hypothetical protein
VPLWAVILIALLGNGVGAALYKAWCDKKKIPSEIRASDAQTARAVAEIGGLRIYGGTDGSPIERLGHAVEQAWARVEKLQQVVFQQADEITRLRKSNEESNRQCEERVASLERQVRELQKLET